MKSCLNTDVLKELLEMDRENESKGEFLREVTDLFMRTAGPLHEKLITAVKKKDVNLTRHLAHKLKGVTANIGAHILEASCGEIERQAADGYLPQLETVEALGSELSNATHALQVFQNS